MNCSKKARVVNRGDCNNTESKSDAREQALLGLETDVPEGTHYCCNNMIIGFVLDERDSSQTMNCKDDLSCKSYLNHKGFNELSYIANNGDCNKLP